MEKSINFLCRKQLLGQEWEYRNARISDFEGIFCLLDYYHARGFVRKITREQILKKIDNFFVVVSKDALVACICLQLFFEERKAFISSVVVSPDYINMGVGTEMEKIIERSVQKQEIDKMLLVSKKRKDWWIKRGFAQDEFNSLPEIIRAEYDFPVNAVLSKRIKKEKAMSIEKVFMLTADQTKKGEAWFKTHKATCHICKKYEKYKDKGSLKPDLLSKIFSLSGGKVIAKFRCLCGEEIDVTENQEDKKKQKGKTKSYYISEYEMAKGFGWVAYHSQECILLWQPIDGIRDCESEENIFYEFIDLPDNFLSIRICCDCGEKCLISGIFQLRAGLIGLTD